MEAVYHPDGHYVKEMFRLAAKVRELSKVFQSFR